MLASLTPSRDSCADVKSTRVGYRSGAADAVQQTRSPAGATIRTPH